MKSFLFILFALVELVLFQLLLFILSFVFYFPFLLLLPLPPPFTSFLFFLRPVVVVVKHQQGGVLLHHTATPQLQTSNDEENEQRENPANTIDNTQHGEPGLLCWYYCSNCNLLRARQGELRAIKRYTKSPWNKPNHLARG